MASSFKNMSDTELLKTLQQKRSEVREFRFDVAGSKAANVHEKRNAKKDIARILTELRRRELEAVTEQHSATQ
jgi:ribosomal protein L29